MNSAVFISHSGMGFDFSSFSSVLFLRRQLQVSVGFSKSRECRISRMVWCALDTDWLSCFSVSVDAPAVVCVVTAVCVVTIVCVVTTDSPAFAVFGKKLPKMRQAKISAIADED